MRMPRVDLTLMTSMLLVGLATTAGAQPIQMDMKALDVVQIADQRTEPWSVSRPAVCCRVNENAEYLAVGWGLESVVAKARKVEGGMSWTEVTLARALLAGQIEERPFAITAHSIGTRLSSRG